MTIKEGQKTVLITGCTPGGIGHALCLEFHAKGLHVIATARRPEVLAELARLGMTTLPLDVTNKESIAACKAAVQELTGGTLDILVNNAGLTHTIPATDIDLDDVRNTFETNVFGVMAMCQAFARPLARTRGLIVQISSVSSVAPYVFGSVYCATKGALNAYSRTLRAELRPYGVRVLVSMTGTVRSNIASRTHRALPAGSLFGPVADLFRRRLTWSQDHAAVDTDAFARGLVAAALRGPGWLGGWLGGTPDWFWAGGMARLAWVGTWLGERVVDAFITRLFPLKKLEDHVRKEGVEKSE